MKPDWKDAPEWAEYLAMDSDGTCWWYENEPVLNCVDWLTHGRVEHAPADPIEWKDTLEKRKRRPRQVSELISGQ